MIIQDFSSEFVFKDYKQLLSYILVFNKISWL